MSEQNYGIYKNIKRFTNSDLNVLKDNYYIYIIPKENRVIVSAERNGSYPIAELGRDKTFGTIVLKKLLRPNLSTSVIRGLSLLIDEMNTYNSVNYYIKKDVI